MMLPNLVLCLVFLMILCRCETFQGRSGKPERKENKTLILRMSGTHSTKTSARPIPNMKYRKIVRKPERVPLKSEVLTTSTDQNRTPEEVKNMSETTVNVMRNTEPVGTNTTNENTEMDSPTEELEVEDKVKKDKVIIRPLPRAIAIREERAGGFNCHPKWYSYFTYISRSTAGYCAGTLLSSQYVLTAGHCCYGHQIGGVYAGYYHDRNTWDQYLEAINVIVHGQYDNDTFQYDACIIKVAGFQKASVIKFVNLDPSYRVNDQVFSVGYATNRSMQMRDLLHLEAMPCVEGTVLSEEECKRKMSASNIEVSYYDPETMICTEPIYRRSEKKMEPDAGGPLIMSKHQVGISSFVLATKDGFGLSFHAQVDAVYQFLNAYVPQARSDGNKFVSLTYLLIFTFMLLYIGNI